MHNEPNAAYDNSLNLLGRICAGMFGFVDNVRMFRVGNFITVFTLILLLGGAAATTLTFKSVADIAGVWRDFDSGLARRIDLLGHFEHHLGYSGLAQYWPAASAGNPAAKQAAGEALSKVREGFPAFLNASPTDQEKADLAVLERAVAAYERNLAGAAEKIDEAAAAAALNGIKQSLANRRKAGADAVEDAIWALSAKVGGIMFAAGAILALFGMFTFWFIRFRVAMPLSAINLTMTGLSTGDTGVIIPFTTKTDEVGEMARSVQVFKNNALAKQRMEDQKHRVTRSVQDTTTELAQLTKSVRSATAEQASASSSMATATEELTVSIDQVAENAGRALTMTRETVTAVKDGERAVHEAITVMEDTAKLVFNAAARVDELGRQSTQIQDIVTAIQAIAKQTDLLALNASIESARAGEAGRGFSVVADEVRSLAEKTTTSAHDISGILTKIRDQMEQVSTDVGSASDKARESATRSRDVEEALARIDKRSELVAGAMEDIAGAAREQSSAGHEIAQQVEMVAGSSETISRQINRIDELTHGLNGTVATI